MACDLKMNPYHSERLPRTYYNNNTCNNNCNQHIPNDTMSSISTMNFTIDYPNFSFKSFKSHTSNDGNNKNEFEFEDVSLGELSCVDSIDSIDNESDIFDFDADYMTLPLPKSKKFTINITNDKRHSAPIAPFSDIIKDKTGKVYKSPIKAYATMINNMNRKKYNGKRTRAKGRTNNNNEDRPLFDDGSDLDVDLYCGGMDEDDNENNSDHSDNDDFDADSDADANSVQTSNTTVVVTNVRKNGNFEVSPTVSISANAGDIVDVNDLDVCDTENSDYGNDTGAGHSPIIEKRGSTDSTSSNGSNVSVSLSPKDARLVQSLPLITAKFDELFPFYRLSDKDCKQLSLLVLDELDTICRVFCNSHGRTMQVKIYYYNNNEPKILTYFNRIETDTQVKQWNDITMNKSYCLKYVKNHNNNHLI